MDNLIFVKIEIFVFLFSFLYVFYYLLIKLWPVDYVLKIFAKPDLITLTKTPFNKVILNSTKWESEIKSSHKIKISEKDKQKIAEIIKRVKLNSSKWYFDTAKNLIVEWLSLDKFNKELNLELAKIYEQEHNYINAEYIYKDLLEVLKVDFEVMKKLWYIYAMQNKLKESLNIYEQIHNKKMADDEVIDLLSELTYNMKNYKKALKYINLFLAWKPRNVDKLFMKWKSLRELWNKKEASLVYKRILDLQPYNSKAKENYEKYKDKKELIDL